MFLLNSRLSHFIATPLRSRGKPDHEVWHSLYQGYGVILPSSFSRVIPSALGYSPHLPVSVLVRTVSRSLEAFLGTHSTQFTRLAACFPPCLEVGWSFNPTPPTHRAVVNQTPRLGLLDASLHHSNAKHWGRNFRLLPIDYAFRPRLRIRLTLG